MGSAVEEERRKDSMFCLQYTSEPLNISVWYGVGPVKQGQAGPEIV